MRFLLDTHTLVWWVTDDPQLSSDALEILRGREHEILVSAATAWEISTKYRLGKLRAVESFVTDMTGWIREEGFAELPVDLRHGEKAGSWPQEHRDPFDRMLAAQSALEDVPLVTRDAAFTQFGIQTVW